MSLEYAVLVGVFFSIIVFIFILGKTGSIIQVSFEEILGAAVMIVIVAYVYELPIGISLIMGFLILAVLVYFIHKVIDLLIDRLINNESVKNFLFGKKPPE